MACLAVFAGAFAPRADAFIYWADNGGSEGTTIGRASLDGGDVDRSFIDDLDGPCGVAVDANHIYWANQDPNRIGRANIDGTGVDRNFINLTGLPCGVAVDGAHIWWAGIGDDVIGRANLDGTGVDQDKFNAPQAQSPCGIAVRGDLVYWANSDSDAIEHAGNPEPPPSPMPVVPAAGDNPCWPAVTADHIYWATLPFGLHRTDLNGDNFDTVTPANAFGGVGILESRLYWASVLEGTISSANLDGTSPFIALVRNIGAPGGLAVDSRGPPPGPPGCGDLTLGKAKKNKRKGTAKLPAEVECAGSLEVGGKGVKPAEKQADGAGEVKLPIKSKGKKKRKLKQKGKAKVEAEVTFTPTGGTPTTEDKKVKLVKK